MSKKGWLGMLIIVLAFGTMVIGCDIPDENSIIGFWEEYPSGTTLNFKSDNTVVIKHINRSAKTWSYELIDKTLEISNSDGDSYTGNYKFDYSNQEKKLILSGFSATPGSDIDLLDGTYFKK